MANAPDTVPITEAEATTGKCLTASSAAAAEFSIQARNAGILLKSSPSASPPTSWVGAWEIAAGDGFFDVTIAHLWPGSTDTHLHVIGPAGAEVFFVSA